KKDSVAMKLIHLTISGEVSNRTRTVLEKTLRSETALNPMTLSTKTGANISVGYDAKVATNPSSPPPLYVTELITLLIGSPEFQQR
ncbi:MAG: hypothetical protein QOI77_2244, partial [Blastocatellia bacterium]|nr:hypothetical protein [Blastocatellia bacterium]